MNVNEAGRSLTECFDLSICSQGLQRITKSLGQNTLSLNLVSGARPLELEARILNPNHISLN
jgi:hypothetical protein